MFFRTCVFGFFTSILLSSPSLAAPVIDPLPNVTIPAGKSLIIPITASVNNGRPLTYTIKSSTNGFGVVMHTNNPFWQLSMVQAANPGDPGAYQTPFRGGVATVTNVGNMTFMLFPDYAPHTVNVFQGLTASGFYNSNTIFHLVSSNAYILGGDPLTNGTGGLIFQYDDEITPQSIFSGGGQLALENFGPDTDGSQFFVTLGPLRSADLRFTVFGQLVRGFDVLTNIDFTAVDANRRPLADEIIQTASWVTNATDTVVTLTATNIPGLSGTISVIADDGVGGRATNIFTAQAIQDTNNSNYQPFIYPNTVTNMVGPVNKTITNTLSAYELDNEKLYWFAFFGSQADSDHTASLSGNYFTNRLKTLTYNVTNSQGLLQIFVVPTNNYIGPVTLQFDMSDNSEWNIFQEFGLSLPPYDQQRYTFVFGDTPIVGQSQTVGAVASVPLSSAILATFTNGVPGSSSTNFTAAINWGDNSTNSGVVVTNSAGRKAVLGSHTYQYPGTYPVYVQAQNYIGASATILSYIVVTNQATPASTLFTMHITGQGMVSPVYSNVVLNVGDSYTVSASSTGNWVFINWTDGNGYALGTSTNLTFTMYQGLSLTANFALGVPPTVTIASPANGRIITNLYSAPVTISGTASDNTVITQVWYQINSGGWQMASGTTAWNVSFAPVSGVTNTFKVYAVNNLGMISTTNTLIDKYLAGDILTLATNGLGSISPDRTGQVLPLGTNYVLTAVTNVGFAFVNWTGSIVTNKAALSFTMAPSLHFTANFVETAKPTVSITNLTNGQKMTNALAYVIGTAKDDWGVQSVWLQLNSNSWNSVSTANAYTNWTTTLTLMASTNTLKTYAVNLGGIYSVTNTLRIVSSNTFQLQLTFTNAQPLKSHGLDFSLDVSKGLNGYIEVSPDLENWLVLTNFVGTNTTLHFTDPAATNSVHRFYRAVIP